MHMTERSQNRDHKHIGKAREDTSATILPLPLQQHASHGHQQQCADSPGTQIRRSSLSCYCFWNTLTSTQNQHCRDSVKTKDVLELCYFAFPDGIPLGCGSRKNATTGSDTITIQGQRQHLTQAHSQTGGPGLQPRGPGGDREEVLEERLVQNPAAEADCQRGRLSESHRHQPLLLWTVQLLLHPSTHQEGAGVLPILRLLQATEVHNTHC